jgi:hypothetical protein
MPVDVNKNQPNYHENMSGKLLRNARASGKRWSLSLRTYRQKHWNDVVATPSDYELHW